MERATVDTTLPPGGSTSPGPVSWARLTVGAVLAIASPLFVGLLASAAAGGRPIHLTGTWFLLACLLAVAWVALIVRIADTHLVSLGLMAMLLPGTVSLISNGSYAGLALSLTLGAVGGLVSRAIRNGRPAPRSGWTLLIALTLVIVAGSLGLRTTIAEAAVASIEGSTLLATFQPEASHDARQPWAFALLSRRESRGEVWYLLELTRNGVGSWVKDEPFESGLSPDTIPQTLPERCWKPNDVGSKPASARFGLLEEPTPLIRPCVPFSPGGLIVGRAPQGAASLEITTMSGAVRRRHLSRTRSYILPAGEPRTGNLPREERPLRIAYRSSSGRLIASYLSPTIIEWHIAAAARAFNTTIPHLFRQDLPANTVVGLRLLKGLEYRELCDDWAPAGEWVLLARLRPEGRAQIDVAFGFSNPLQLSWETALNKAPMMKSSFPPGCFLG